VKELEVEIDENGYPLIGGEIFSPGISIPSFRYILGKHLGVSTREALKFTVRALDEESWPLRRDE